MKLKTDKRGFFKGLHFMQVPAHCCYFALVAVEAHGLYGMAAAAL